MDQEANNSKYSLACFFPPVRSLEFPKPFPRANCGIEQVT